MRALTIAMLLVFGNLAPAEDAPLLDLSSSEMRPMIQSFAADRGNLLRSYNIEGSATRQNRLRKFYTEWRDRLPRLNFDGMSQDGKIDYLLLRNYLDHELRQLSLDTKTAAEAMPYVPFAPAIVALEESRRRMEPVEPRQAAEALTLIEKQVEEARRDVESRMRAESTPGMVRNRKVAGSRAAATVTALRDTLRQWFHFYENYDPLFTWWAEASYKTADSALQTYLIFLRERVAGSPAQTASGGSEDIIGNPIGREGLLSELAYEMIPYSPDELVAIAGKEFAWCETEMKRASREMGYGDDWKKALEKVKTMHVEPGKQPDLVRDLAREAEAFLDDHDLVTVPTLARETFRMEMMTPERQLINPFFTGGEVMSVSYPVTSMSYEQKMMSMRGNNIPFSRATVFHEQIPGHHLQGFFAARFRPYRAVVGGTPFMTEGWSLYWELLLWDLKFQKTPEDRVGALFWRMHRCARIIFSLSFHLGKMTPDECIAFLVDRVGHERDNAIGEVRRSFMGKDGPLYQAAYLLGGLQIYALHKELVDSGKMTNRQFHDAILQENRIPVEMVRASLITQRLTRNFATSWKFYTEPSK